MEIFTQTKILLIRAIPAIRVLRVPRVIRVLRVIRVIRVLRVLSFHKIQLLPKRLVCIQDRNKAY